MYAPRWDPLTEMDAPNRVSRANSSTIFTGNRSPRTRLLTQDCSLHSMFRHNRILSRISPLIAIRMPVAFSISDLLIMHITSYVRQDRAPQHRIHQVPQLIHTVVVFLDYLVRSLVVPPVQGEFP